MATDLRNGKGKPRYISIIERMRLKLLVDANGVDRMRQMLTSGTWPVEKQGTAADEPAAAMDATA